MLQLSGRLKPAGPVLPDKILGKITTNRSTPGALRPSMVLLAESMHDVLNEGQYAAVLIRPSCGVSISTPVKNAFLLTEAQDYLGDGDVIRIDPTSGQFRTLYRRKSKQNSFLVTERCNSYCIMCSQPPRKGDDSHVAQELKLVIPMVDRATEEIGLTGGEPTLLGDDFFELVQIAKNHLPSTALHILSNGRNFKSDRLAARLASINHPDLMVGIPLYSDISNIHDFVVQADGAFDETIRGIMNLKNRGVRVEIRVVIHRANYDRLPRLADFIARNLLFVDHVALMGLELFGFAKTNVDALWIDPMEYQPQLKAAVHLLDSSGIITSIYNHQLCLLDPSLWPFSRKSISDWKNEYHPECGNCSQREKCGGFFSSSFLRLSKHIRALPHSGQA